MAERDGQGHDEVCATASGHICVCACRGRFHGVTSSAHHGRSRLARMADVDVKGRTDIAPTRGGGKAETPAQRRHNPVRVGGGDERQGDRVADTATAIRDMGEDRSDPYFNRVLRALRASGVTKGEVPDLRRQLRGDQSGLYDWPTVKDALNSYERDWAPSDVDADGKIRMRDAIGREIVLDARRGQGDDVPKVTHRDGLDRRHSVPADLAGLGDDELTSLMLDHPDHADRIGEELDRRDADRQYRELVDSVPDAGGLERVDDDRLMDLYARVTATAGDPDAAAMGRLEAELDRRTELEQRNATLREYVNRDPQSMTDDELDIAARHAATLDDAAALDRIYGEWDRRAQLELDARRREQTRKGDAPDDWLSGPGGGDSDWPTHWRDEVTPEEKRVNDLVADGWDWMEAYAEVHGTDADRMRLEEAGQIAGRTSGRTEVALRRQYDEHVSLAYIEAENGTSGHLLNSRSRAQGVEAIKLFSGPEHVAMAHASEELKRWWATHPRLTYADFRAELLGQGGSAARRRAERSTSEFA